MNLVNLNLPLKMVKGKGRGKPIGIPTLNFAIPKILKLPYGIYAGWLMTKNNKYQTAIHFGPRPQFDETDPSLEAYILDGEIINQNEQLRLMFVGFIRTIERFSSVTEMLKRIETDVKEVKEVLLNL